MTLDSWQRLRSQLVLHEGQRLELYTDTNGLATIGVGHCLAVHGISQAVCDRMLDEDMGRAFDGVKKLPWFGSLSEVRQRVILDMVFNLGLAGLSKFTHMIAAIVAGEYVQAASHMRDSLWARQVGHRADRLAQMMATGKDYTT